MTTVELSMQTVNFIRAHREENVRELALHTPKDEQIDLPFALDQISGWQKARTKLPHWAQTAGIVYPPHLAMEQCSSQYTAQYKARLAEALCRQQEVELEISGPIFQTNAGNTQESIERANTEQVNTRQINIKQEKMGQDFSAVTKNAGAVSSTTGKSIQQQKQRPRRLVDLTGGFAVDFSFMAPLFERAVYVERQHQLCELAEHNTALLGLTNTTIVNADADEYVTAMPQATLLYIDPARRDTHGRRTYAISDCTPNVIALKDCLLKKADFVLIKLSPMLDWKKAAEDLGDCVREIHIVSVANECKELLIVLRKRKACENFRNIDSGNLSRVKAQIQPVTQLAQTIQVYCVNDEAVFSFEYNTVLHTEQLGTQPQEGSTVHSDGNSDISRVSTRHDLEEQQFLYEPNASIMKAGCFSLVEQRFVITQLSVNSHLFVSKRDIQDFPGRKFTILAVSGMNKKELRTTKQGLTHANIAVRNFPLTAMQLRTKLNLQDGGNSYIFGTTTENNEHVILLVEK